MPINHILAKRILILFKLNEILTMWKLNKMKIKKITMSACHIISFVQSDADYWPWGVNQGIFILQVGIYKFYF